MQQLLFQRRLMREKGESCTVQSCSIMWQLMYCTFWQVPLKTNLHARVLWIHALGRYYLGKKKCFSLHLTAGGSISVEREEEVLFSLCLKIFLYRRCTETLLCRLFLVLLGCFPQVNWYLLAGFWRQKLPTRAKECLRGTLCWAAKGWDEGERERRSKIEKGNSSQEGCMLAHPVGKATATDHIAK